jgi:hypothetical protein
MLSSKSYKRNTKHYTKNWRIRKHIASSCSQTTTSSPDQPKSTRSTSRTLSSTKGTLSLQPLLDHPSHPFFDHQSTYHSTIAAHSSTILPSILPAIPKRRLRPRRKIFRMSTAHGLFVKETSILRVITTPQPKAPSIATTTKATSTAAAPKARPASQKPTPRVSTITKRQSVAPLQSHTALRAPVRKARFTSGHSSTVLRAILSSYPS